MLVYGDHRRRVDPRARLNDLVARAPHDRRTALLLDAGELAQGLIDHEFEATGIDEITPLASAAMDLVRDIAAGTRALDRHPLRALSLPERVSLSRPEGFAFYAVYPDAWASAARPFVALRSRVIGIRSIGLTLGAVVAATVDAERFVSVRPTGHPFDRTLAIGPALERWLIDDDAEVTYLVADEGPGLSGSSFASVGAWLIARGVAHDRVVFMPSHAGEPGPHASVAVRRIWQVVQRVVPGAPRVLATFAGAEDLGGGRWRRHIYGERRWPPANPQQERCKLLLRDDLRPRLAKFAGLGRYGEDKLALAQILADRGWTTAPIELIDGFLISEWLPDALPLDHLDSSFDRNRLIRQLSEYIAFRSAACPADPDTGASVETLFRMLLHNAELALGPDARDRFATWQPSLDQLADGLRPCKTDNRMHRCEWLVTPDGALRKADAVDHHAAHDLIGSQDPLWDLVGARHELMLDPREFLALREQLARQLGRRFTDAQTDFFSAAYLAFQCGAATLAARTAADPDAGLLRDQARRYAAALGSFAPSGP